MINSRENNQIDENTSWNDLWVEVSPPAKQPLPFSCFEIKSNDTIRIGDALIEIITVNN